MLRYQLKIIKKLVINLSTDQTEHCLTLEILRELAFQEDKPLKSVRQITLIFSTPLLQDSSGMGDMPNMRGGQQHYLSLGSPPTTRDLGDSGGRYTLANSDAQQSEENAAAGGARSVYQTLPPRDKWNRFYMGFVLAGIGFLLPYNRWVKTFVFTSFIRCSKSYSRLLKKDK